MAELIKIIVATAIVIIWVLFLYWSNNTTEAKRKRREFNEREGQINKILASVRSGKEQGGVTPPGIGES